MPLNVTVFSKSKWFVELNDWFPTLFQSSDATINVALYNITADPYEKNDLSKKCPDEVKKLQDRLKYYMKGLVPPPNEPPDPEARRVAMENDAWTPWMWKDNQMERQMLIIMHMILTLNTIIFSAWSRSEAWFTNNHVIKVNLHKICSWKNLFIMKK